MFTRSAHSRLAVLCGLTLLPLTAWAEPALQHSQNPNTSVSTIDSASDNVLGTITATKERWEPQSIPRSDHQDTYHGITVKDPYRWLEDIDSLPTQNWVKHEIEQTDEYFAKQLPDRRPLHARLSELQDFEKYGFPWECGQRIFYQYNSGLEDQSSFYVTDNPQTHPNQHRKVLDVSKMSKDGTIALSMIQPSEDGKYIAYAVSEAGSDWSTIKVMDVDLGRTLDDELRWVKFSNIAWDGDNKGFFYSRYPIPAPGEDLKAVNHNHTLCYHKVGTPQSQDKKIFAIPEHPDWMVNGEVSEDGRWLIISSENPDTDNTTTWVHRLDSDNDVFEELPHSQEARFYIIDIDGDRAIAYSDYQAPKFRLLSIDLSQEKSKRQWTELVPEQPFPISGACRAGNSLLVTYYRDAQNQIVRYDLQGKRLGEIPLPGLGSASFASARHDKDHAYLRFSNFTTPATIYRYDLKSGRLSPWNKPRTNFDSSQFETKQVFCTSADGCRVPMFISCKKGAKLDGTMPVLMYGYGGFNIGMTPYFSSLALAWMEMGGAYVVVNTRGGDEYGAEWHEMGTKTHKQNVFNDFIAAAHYLIDNKYTNSKRLAIMGGSNGGLLVAACLNQAPDLFGAVICQVGVLDMLRFSKFTIGYYWVADYGDVANEDEFKALYAYSPYHNVIENGHYPPTLITTADHDDRVFPAHSFKYTAAMQHAQAGEAPILIRIESRAGHGGGKPTSKRLNESADILAFLCHALQVNPDTAKDDTAKVKPQ